MSLTKYASFEVSEILDIKGAENRVKTASLDKLADFHEYRTEDGYLYVRIRAISSRVNKNNDGWPSVELAGSQDIFDRHQAASGGFTVEAADGSDEYGFATFIGKPIFVDHHNSDPKRARGVIVDAKFHVEDHKTAAGLDPYYANAPDNHLPPSWVELLLEVDAEAFPRFAKAITEGAKDSSKGIDGWSMGCDVEKSICNICSHVATAPDEYCNHIKLKGLEHTWIDDKTGEKISKRSYEDCVGIKFFEISGVFDPADETALTSELREAVHKEAGVRIAENPLPQADLTKAPEEVDTLREEKVCPVCGSDMDAEKCEVCGYDSPPDSLNNPDLDKAEQVDLHEEPETDLNFTAPEDEDAGGESYLQARKPNDTGGVTSSMAWKGTVHPRVASKLAERESDTATEEPNEETVKDEDEPVTSARTAEDLVAGAERNQEDNTMSDENKVAATPADPSAKPDKQVDVTGVGGVVDATNEEASKADAQVDVEGKGGTGVEDVSADKTESVEKEVTTDDSGPTSTFPKQKNHLDAGSVHDNEPFPKGGAKKGTDPVDAVGKPDERVDVEQEVSVSWNQSETGTDQWTGTDGNGVTRQADPVTRQVDPNIEQPRSSHTFTAHTVKVFKVADTEVAVGLLDESRKYERISELAEKPESVVDELLAYASKVKEAGLAKQQTPKTARKLPSFSKAAAVEAETSTVTSSVDEVAHDSALFS
jgi:hypothetical protein